MNKLLLDYPDFWILQILINRKNQIIQVYLLNVVNRCTKDSTSRLSLLYLQLIFGKWYRIGNGAQ